MTWTGDPGELVELIGYTAELIARSRPTWHARAACRGTSPAPFFPASGVNVDRARAICATCPVIDACLSCAMADENIRGVWGGTTALERRQLRREAA